MKATTTLKTPRSITADADTIFKATRSLIKEIHKNEQKIYNLLLAVESRETIEDEITKSIDCLENIEKEYEYIHAAHVPKIASLLPVNLPLYSLILFAAVPSFMCNEIIVRPPHAMQTQIHEIFKLLRFKKHFPNITLLENVERDAFKKNVVMHTNVVLFTGSHRNALKLQETLPKQSLFVYNGAGLNPVVVFENADLELAAEKTLDVKIFNSGQDCAGPDAILVHENVKEHFCELLIAKLREVKVSNSYLDGARIGPLIESTHFPDLSTLLLRNAEYIVHGGNIRFSDRTVEPTVIVKDLELGTNYEEIFAPIFFISTFNDTNFASYFSADHYKNYAMYVSIFGSSPLESAIIRSVILRNKNIIEIERGNNAYGGYGLIGSYVSHNGRKHIRPILISREIAYAFGPTG